MFSHKKAQKAQTDKDHDVFFAFVLL